MDLNISDSTDESYVFVGPVTQRELILTWKKRRQLKLEQEREKAESHNILESSDEVLLSDVREPTKGENDDHPSESSLPSDDPSVNSPFSSSSAVEVATIERITPEKIEEPVRGINVEVAPCVPEAPSPEKACDVVSPKDPLASPPADVRNNIVSPECANEGDEMAAEPVPPSTVSAGNMIQGKPINLSSSILGVETDLPTRESIAFSTDNFQENTHSVCDEDDDSSDSFEDASEEFVITMSKKGRSPISTQMIEVLPVVSDQASLEDHLGVTLDPDELSSLLDQFEMSNIGLRGANKEGRPSIKDSEPQSPSSTDVSLQGLENDILLALDETPRSQRDHHAAKRISCTNEASESDVDSPELTVSSPAQEDTHGQDHTDATRDGSPTNPQTVAHPTPLLLPPVEPKSAPPRTSESFDDSSTESASIPPTRNILRPPKFVVPSTFDGGWGKKLKLKPSNKPKRPAYVQPLNNHEL